MVFHQNFYNFFSAFILWWNFIHSLSGLTVNKLKKMSFIVLLIFSQNWQGKTNNLEHSVRMEKSNIGAFLNSFNNLYI